MKEIKFKTEAEENKQTVWDRMTPLQRWIAQSKDRADAAARSARNLKR